MKMKIICTLIGVCLLTVVLGLPLSGETSGKMSGTSYDIPAQVLDSGGLSSSSSNYNNIGAIGQPAGIGETKGTKFMSKAGFIPIDVHCFDLDGDGGLDRDDYNFLRAHVNKPLSTCTQCDLNEDGAIDELDLRILVLHCVANNCPGCICKN